MRYVYNQQLPNDLTEDYFGRFLACIGAAGVVLALAFFGII